MEWKVPCASVDYQTPLKELRNSLLRCIGKLLHRAEEQFSDLKPSSGSHYDLVKTATCSTGLDWYFKHMSKTENRGIRVAQLLDVKAHIKRRCVKEEWLDHNGSYLTADRVNLYETCSHVIKPATEKYQISYVDFVCPWHEGIQRAKPTWFVSHCEPHQLPSTLLCKPVQPVLLTHFHPTVWCTEPHHRVGRARVRICRMPCTAQLGP
eukprot:1735898-Prymnesium_polylepis.2